MLIPLPKIRKSATYTEDRIRPGRHLFGRRGPSSPKLTSESHHTNLLQPSPNGLSFPKLMSKLRRVRGQRPNPRDLWPWPPNRQTRRTPKQTVGTQNTDIHHRYRCLAAVARHTVVSQNQLHQSGHDQHRVGNKEATAPTQDLQRLQALARSCSVETAADFQPTDDNLNLHSPFPTSYRVLRNTDQKPSLQRWSVSQYHQRHVETQGFSTGLLCTSSASHAAAGTKRSLQNKAPAGEVNKETKTSTQITKTH